MLMIWIRMRLSLNSLINVRLLDSMIISVRHLLMRIRISYLKILSIATITIFSFDRRVRSWKFAFIKKFLSLFMIILYILISRCRLAYTLTLLVMQSRHNSLLGTILLSFSSKLQLWVCPSHLGHSWSASLLGLWDIHLVIPFVAYALLGTA